MAQPSVSAAKVKRTSGWRFLAGCPILTRMNADAAGRNAWTIPNLLSGLRLALVPILLILAWRGERRLFLVCLAVAFLSDLLDGVLARLLDQRSELGAKLDQGADVAVFLSLPIAFWWLWPEVVRSERGFIALALAGYAVPAALALRKFGRLASYHTWIGKTATATLSVGTLLLVMGWAHWPFRAGILLIVLACVEEFAISLVLSEPRSNVASFWHAQRPAKSSRRSA